MRLLQRPHHRRRRRPLHVEQPPLHPAPLGDYTARRGRVLFISTSIPLSHPAELRLASAALRRLLVVAAATTCLFGLFSELTRAALDLQGAAAALASALSLSYEGNLPTWHASALALLIAALLAWIAAITPTDRPHWRGLALGFLVISIDEIVGAHEQLSPLIDTDGLLYFGWVIPAGALVIVLGLIYLGFLRRLPPKTARRFTLAGALYLSGALLLELPLGYWTETYGDDGLGYALIDWCEEALEFTGLTLFALHLLHLLEGSALRLDRAPSHVTPPHRPDEAVVPEVHQRDHQRR